MIVKRFALVFFIISLFSLSCVKNESSKHLAGKHFDLKSYFSAQANLLKKRNPEIEKSAIQNGIAEKKTFTIPNWDTELELFSESDINKPAWNDSYKTSVSGNQITYLALDPKLRTRNITLSKTTSGEIYRVQIINESTNYLYSSNEVLNYYPDSLYTIQKKLDVLFLGKNDYFISGRIKN